MWLYTDAEDEHSKESEVNCVDTQVDDEIKGKGESEIVIATVTKCEKNLAIEVVEDMNEDILNVQL